MNPVNNASTQPSDHTLSLTKIGIIGLGYVGLPLALEFGAKYDTVGFDIAEQRIRELQEGHDRTREATNAQFAASTLLTFSADPTDLATCTVFIITVPTPIDRFKRPDLSYLYSASSMVGKALKPGDVVIYESTVYPGCTEEDCVPVLEKHSGLRFNVDFFCGYSPERINPGDKVRTLTKIRKITSGSMPNVATFVDKLYCSIIEAGTYLAPSIKVAEAAKAIENAQRDLNISFVNELALIFDRMGIDTLDVLEAAGTKWNFLNFRPGLVGGHCISVDPYYLVHKAQSLGYYPQVIMSGRRINDDMGIYVANKLVKAIIQAGMPVSGANVLLLGITFKENCGDIRNTRVVDIYHELTGFNVNVHIYDPWADPTEVAHEHGLTLTPTLDSAGYDGVILAVAHDEFRRLDIAELKKHEQTVIYDLKSILNRNTVSMRM